MLLQIVKFFMEFKEVFFWTNLFSVTYLIISLSIVLKISSIIENEEKARRNSNEDEANVPIRTA